MLFVSGDNILTGVSVARQCGMVPTGDRLIFVNAYHPEGDQPAQIHWVDEATELTVTSNGQKSNGHDPISLEVSHMVAFFQIAVFLQSRSETDVPGDEHC